MVAKLDMTGNEAVSKMVEVLARHYYKGPAARAELRKWLDEIEKPVSYSYQDVDRAGGLAEFLTNLVK
jgi:hypothetical protein